MTTPEELDALQADLREEAVQLHGIGIERGNLDATISGILADAADAAITALRARVAELEKSVHYANGTADLAMKHRDAAEAELARRGQVQVKPLADAGESLLPCPFCGSEVRMIEGEESAYIQCLGVKMHRAIWFSGDNCAADEVREQWNTRAALVSPGDAAPPASEGA